MQVILFKVMEQLLYGMYTQKPVGYSKLLVAVAQYNWNNFQYKHEASDCLLYQLFFDFPVFLFVRSSSVMNH